MTHQRRLDSHCGHFVDRHRVASLFDSTRSMYCWIAPENAYSICIHTSFGGKCRGALRLVANLKRGEASGLSPLSLFLDLDVEEYLESLLALTLGQLSTFASALLSSSSRYSRSVM